MENITLPIYSKKIEKKCLQIIYKWSRNNPKIKVHWNSILVDILGTREGGVTSAKLQDKNTGAIREDSCEGIFMAIGHLPKSQLFTGYLNMDPAGYIITGPVGTATNVEAVFACGDIQDHEYRQAITAAGSGCMAAIDAERWLDIQYA